MTAASLDISGAGQWRLTGVLDFDAVPGLADKGARLIARMAPADSVEIDLAGVESANSAGLALLLEWLDLAGQRGVHLTYRHLPESLRRIAAFSNLHDLLPIAG